MTGIAELESDGNKLRVTKWLRPDEEVETVYYGKLLFADWCDMEVDRLGSAHVRSAQCNGERYIAVHYNE